MTKPIDNLIIDLLIEIKLTFHFYSFKLAFSKQLINNRLKTIRFLAAALLFLTAVLHLYIAIITKPDPGFIMYIVFSLIYLALGILLVSKIKLAVWFGLLIPLAVLIIYPFVVSFKNLNPWSSGILAAIDATIAICCFVLLLLRIKT
jgi:hypothetical protein